MNKHRQLPSSKSPYLSDVRRVYNTTSKIKSRSDQVINLKISIGDNAEKMRELRISIDDDNKIVREDNRLTVYDPNKVEKKSETLAVGKRPNSAPLNHGNHTAYIWRSPRRMRIEKAENDLKLASVSSQESFLTDDIRSHRPRDRRRDEICDSGTNYSFEKQAPLNNIRIDDQENFAREWQPKRHPSNASRQKSAAYTEVSYDSLSRNNAVIAQKQISPYRPSSAYSAQKGGYYSARARKGRVIKSNISHINGDIIASKVSPARGTSRTYYIPLESEAQMDAPKGTWVNNYWWADVKAADDIAVGEGHVESQSVEHRADPRSPQRDARQDKRANRRVDRDGGYKHSSGEVGVGTTRETVSRGRGRVGYNYLLQSSGESLAVMEDRSDYLNGHSKLLRHNQQQQQQKGHRERIDGSPKEEEVTEDTEALYDDIKYSGRGGGGGDRNGNRAPPDTTRTVTWQGRGDAGRGSATAATMEKFRLAQAPPSSHTEDLSLSTRGSGDLSPTPRDAPPVPARPLPIASPTAPRSPRPSSATPARRPLRHPPHLLLHQSQQEQQLQSPPSPVPPRTPCTLSMIVTVEMVTEIHTSDPKGHTAGLDRPLPQAHSQPSPPTPSPSTPSEVPARIRNRTERPSPSSNQPSQQPSIRKASLSVSVTGHLDLARKLSERGTPRPPSPVKGEHPSPRAPLSSSSSSSSCSLSSSASSYTLETSVEVEESSPQQAKGSTSPRQLRSHPPADGSNVSTMARRVVQTAVEAAVRNIEERRARCRRFISITLAQSLLESAMSSALATIRLKSTIVAQHMEHGGSSKRMTVTGTVMGIQKEELRDLARATAATVVQRCLHTAMSTYHMSPNGGSSPGQGGGTDSGAGVGTSESRNSNALAEDVGLDRWEEAQSRAPSRRARSAPTPPAPKKDMRKLLDDYHERAERRRRLRSDSDRNESAPVPTVGRSERQGVGSPPSASSPRRGPDVVGKAKSSGGGRKKREEEEKRGRRGGGRGGSSYRR